MDSWPLSMGLRGCPVTLVRNYHYWLRINPEERSSHLLRSGSLKSRICLHFIGVFVFSFPGIPLSLSLSVSYMLFGIMRLETKTVFKSLLCITFNSAVVVFIL
jgi:hypothetical protein